jgi:4-aminobutyrate aminotransferase-like enzyme/Ser/Thr protein kinase RdoA (MazF antagonist)/murein DD-endopeptidase MepM/ murein hydrolase activator NlpD
MPAAPSRTMLRLKFDLPALSAGDAIAVARESYGLDGTVFPLPGEKDRNFLIERASGERFVLKIANAEENREILELQNAVLEHLAARGVQGVQRVITTRSGESIATVRGSGGGAHFVRLLTYLPGKIWAEARPHTPELLASLGRLLGSVDAALSGFDHPAAHRALKWDLAQAAWIRGYLAHIEDPARRAAVECHADRFEAGIRPRLAGLRRGVIHNDANDYNLLVGGAGPWEREVTGLLDFGDVVHTHTICELAIACAYAMLDKADPLAAAAAIVRGYHAVRALAEEELELLFPLVGLRLAVSVTNSAYQRTAAPEHEYLQISDGPAWRLLEKLAGVRPELAHYTFRGACGLAAVPHSQRVVEWLESNPDAIGRLTEPDLRTAPLIVSDWSVGSVELGSPEDYEDAARLTRAIRDRMAEEGARAAVGRYNEARPLYRSAAFEAQGNDGSEWRSVHIGLDIFLDPGSPVLAPLDGAVHSFANNAARCDYGPCIILEHRVPDGPPFYTLYGHLSEDSLAGLAAGKPVRKGERIGAVGTYPANGDWPPHLHFQIVTDMLGMRGDFPGSCRPSQRDVWLSLSPDPNLIARIPAARLRPAGLDQGEILELRRQRIGYNLSISYRRPLHIVRGYRQWLYDAEGQRYLDAVNNVPHVGHCHPKVVRAGQRQMAVLNTNTRYLHEMLVRYAGRLCATLPEPLRVCFLVNSGSEANELALRLARAHTRQKDTIVVEAAYHGNTTGAIAVSPYKFDHKGGMGAADWVHKVPMPDTYRGAIRADDAEAGARYAQFAGAAIQRIRGLPPHYQPAAADVRYKRARDVAAFLSESILSCGGQIVPPGGYLREVYRLVRAAGGVCIADEVQTGLGRVGSHFWAFETQGVVPDIVTVGKPAGNGHPLGAVVTTPAIAASFHNGLEYFNTFGGNPVSCAIGLAVLDVIEEEGLQANALETGNRLMDGLRGLMREHAIVGDVRGLGLFCGFEMVRDRATLEPAAAEAGYLANRMREHGILLSTDGPLENVIKIKPPLCFDRSNADRVVEALDKILREDFLAG